MKNMSPQVKENNLNSRSCLAFDLMRCPQMRANVGLEVDVYGIDSTLVSNSLYTLLQYRSASEDPFWGQKRIEFFPEIAAADNSVAAEYAPPQTANRSYRAYKFMAKGLAPNPDEPWVAEHNQIHDILRNGSECMYDCTFSAAFYGLTCQHIEVPKSKISMENKWSEYYAVGFNILGHLENFQLAGGFSYTILSANYKSNGHTERKWTTTLDLSERSEYKVEDGLPSQANACANICLNITCHNAHGGEEEVSWRPSKPGERASYYFKSILIEPRPAVPFDFYKSHKTQIILLKL